LHAALKAGINNLLANNNWLPSAATGYAAMLSPRRFCFLSRVCEASSGVMLRCPASRHVFAITPPEARRA
jgi:hypothetical protein